MQNNNNETDFFKTLKSSYCYSRPTCLLQLYWQCCCSDRKEALGKK